MEDREVAFGDLAPHRLRYVCGSHGESELVAARFPARVIAEPTAGRRMSRSADQGWLTARHRLSARDWVVDGPPPALGARLLRVTWTVIGAPLNSSAASGGEALAPRALRAAGLVARIGADDTGDLQGRVGPPERDAASGVVGLPGLQEASEELRDRVLDMLVHGRRPLVLGGDCTLLLGVGAALQRGSRRPGLWFVDGHTDTFDAVTSPTGEAADMELGALTGHGPRELVTAAAGEPVIAPERVIVLGHRHADDLEDARELDLVDQAIARVDARQVRSQGPGAVAARAARRLEAGADAAWLHLDLDVLDQDALPAVSYREPGGLDWDELGELIAPLVASDRLVGMSVADLQAELDQDGTYARQVVELLLTQIADS